MNRNVHGLGFSFLLLVSACSQGERPPPVPVDCSVADGYEFGNIANFSGTESGWFRYVDPTPTGTPSPEEVAAQSNVPVTEIEPPGRCGDTRLLVLEIYGHNFWGGGFGEWAHNQPTSRADGTGYEGISFWARSPAYAEKVFVFNVDDGRTIILDGEAPAGAILPGTECRVPPSSDFGEAACYNGGVDSPASAGVRVPASNECGNAFHKRITTTETWQLFLIPWNELVQWPCPNRLDGGINRTDIAKFEIKLDQGMHYEIWIDNIAFYRRRPGN